MDPLLRKVDCVQIPVPDLDAGLRFYQDGLGLDCDLGRHREPAGIAVQADPYALPALFETAGLSLDVALTARDSDVIKTYVRIGLGVGILARLAIDPVADSDLVVLDASHLFEGHMTWIGFRRSALLRAYMYEFIELLAPHLPRKLVREVEKFDTQEEVDRVLKGLVIPLRDTP